ncbi:hypothetical protein GCM10010129_03320 [Streptomyces fumigatiscleroticus]|nr:hypothetical protein GCM10010129_03320 [Streptomyces fumigatiscleroticus]
MTTAPGIQDTTAASLDALAADAATGALSSERGIVYLSAGHVVHAESALTPDLGTLLTRSGALAPDGWWEAVDHAGVQHRVARRLVDSGRLSAGALELCHLGALFDAAYFVLAHGGRPRRFRAGAAHWLGTVRPVPVATVVRESARRRELLHRIWPEPDIDTAPLARVPDAGATGLPVRRSRILDQVDGVRTATEIAAALGCRTYHTLVELRRLAAGGLVVPAAPGAPPAKAGSGRPAAAQVDPDTALLRRLRDALEAL